MKRLTFLAAAVSALLSAGLAVAQPPGPSPSAAPAPRPAPAATQPTVPVTSTPLTLEEPAPDASRPARPGASPTLPGPLPPRPKTVCEEQVIRAQRDALFRRPPVSFGFPAVPEIEHENSLISFRVCKVKKNLTPEQEARRKASWKCCDPEFYDVELVKMDAYMRLCREPPVINELGFREMRFTIETWELFGHSNLYEADIVFSATPGIVQPKSLAFSTKSAVPPECTGPGAQSAKCKNETWRTNFTEISRSDFPALIIYNAIYDIYLNDKKVVSQEAGIAMARGVKQIPPTGITVAFQKPVEVDGVIKICPGTCNGMVTIPEHLYTAGVETSRRLKAGQLRLDKSFVPAAVQREATPP